MTDQTSSPDIEKTACHSVIGSPGTRLVWRDVVRAVQDPERRSWLVSQLADAGFSLDSVEHTRKAREKLADLLSREEDRLELLRGHVIASTRVAVGSLRRRLELELWP